MRFTGEWMDFIWVLGFAILLSVAHWWDVKDDF